MKGLARKYQHSRCTTEELIAEGHLAIAESIRKYKRTKPATPFATFALVNIREAVYKLSQSSKQEFDFAQHELRILNLVAELRNLLHSPALAKQFLKLSNFSESAFQIFVLNPEKKLEGLSLDYLKANIRLAPSHSKYRATLNTLQNKPGSGSNASFVKANISSELLVYYLKQKIFNAALPESVARKKYESKLKPLLLVESAEFTSDHEGETDSVSPELVRSVLAELETKVSPEDYKLFTLEYLDTSRVKKVLSPSQKKRVYQVRLILEALVLNKS